MGSEMCIRDRAYFIGIGRFFITVRTIFRNACIAVIKRFIRICGSATKVSLGSQHFTPGIVGIGQLIAKRIGLLQYLPPIVITYRCLQAEVVGLLHYKTSSSLILRALALSVSICTVADGFRGRVPEAVIRIGLPYPAGVILVPTGFAF